MTDVKICGLTREEDVASACELGAAIVGFNFIASSPRRVTIARARALGAAAEAAVLRAGIFDHSDRYEIARVVRETGLDIVQLHRPVSAADLKGIPAALAPAVRPEAGRGGLPTDDILLRCRLLLWDSSAGHGHLPDWSLVDRTPLPLPVFVAGGLTAENVGGVIRRLRPAGVDVASGVEKAPGVKDRSKLERFFAAVREADRA